MTTDLEKQFFDTFGIEPKTNREYGYKMAIYNEAGTEEIKFYPRITDHHYLLMLAYLTCCDDKEYGTNETRLKEKILEDMIQEQRLDKLAFEKGWESFDGFRTKDFVQALFKE